MPSTPYTPNGRLTLSITVAGLLHKVRVPCQIVTPIGSANNLVDRVPASTSVLADSAANHLWTLLQPLYPSGVSAPPYTLEENFSGVFVPVQGGTTTGAGTSGSPSWFGSQMTFTYKDSVNHKFKFVLLETEFVPPAHFPYPTGNTPIDNLIADFLSTSLSTSLGNWVLSRGANPLARFTFFTATLNKRVRRSRHLV